MLFWKEWKRGESRIKEIMTERRELGEVWVRNKRRKGRKKKQTEGETLFQAVKMNLHISLFIYLFIFFGRTFTQKFEGLKEGKLITIEKFLKFV